LTTSFVVAEKKWITEDAERFQRSRRRKALKLALYFSVHLLGQLRVLRVKNTCNRTDPLVLDQIGR
jgi:hypothetical protein